MLRRANSQSLHVCNRGCYFKCFIVMTMQYAFMDVGHMRNCVFRLSVNFLTISAPGCKRNFHVTWPWKCYIVQCTSNKHLLHFLHFLGKHDESRPLITWLVASKRWGHQRLSAESAQSRKKYAGRSVFFSRRPRAAAYALFSSGTAENRCRCSENYNSALSWDLGNSQQKPARGSEAALCS